MVKKNTERIVALRSSEHYQQIKQRIKSFVLRGQDADPKELENFVNKLYEAENAVQVINLLGYALGRAMDLNMDAQEAERLLMTGNICFIEEKSRKMLEKIVAKMASFWFSLIPLVVVQDLDKPSKTFDTMLIKVYKNGGPSACNYVDMSGRVYESLQLFLENNKLPFSIVCYPQNGLISFDRAGDIMLECADVGLGNSVLNVMDIATGVVGTVGTVGTIFATGGLAIPFMVAAVGSATYTTGRGIGKLVDGSNHGMSLNPLKDSEARNNWLMISANLLTFASMGTAVIARMESLTVTQAARLAQTGRIIKGVSAGVNLVAAVDSVVYLTANWSTMSIYERIALASAICFCFREVISFANAERLIRESQINGVCNYFRRCAVDATHSASTFMINAREMIAANDEAIKLGLRLVEMLIKENISVTVDEDCTVIRFFKFEYKIKYVLRLEHMQLAKFIYMLQGITSNFRDLFSLLRASSGDRTILLVTSKHGDDLGGNRANYGTAITQILQVIELIRRIANDTSVLTEQGIMIGEGHRFTIKSAFAIFIKTGLTNVIPLVKTLVELNSHEATRLNRFREKFGNEIAIFKWIATGSISSAEMLSKVRCLLQVDALCVDKSLRITELEPPTASIEIESTVQVDFRLFNQVEPAHRSFLVNPKFYRICEPAMCCHREQLKALWINTCLRVDPADKSFEKLAALEHVFQRYPFSVEQAVSFAFELQCADFPQFVSMVLFALNVLEQTMRDEMREEAAANEALFADLGPLKSRYLECKQKAAELGLDGYCPVESMDSTQLVEIVRQLAEKESLRFGTVENAALHLVEFPSLRMKSEMAKFNRFIVMKKFTVEKQSVGVTGGRQKWLIFMANEQLRIVVGVTERVGAYIDTLKFVHA